MFLVSVYEGNVHCQPLYFLYFPLYIILAYFGGPSANKKKKKTHQEDGNLQIHFIFFLFAPCSHL